MIMKMIKALVQALVMDKKLKYRLALYVFIYWLIINFSSMPIARVVMHTCNLTLIEFFFRKDKNIYKYCIVYMIGVSFLALFRPSMVGYEDFYKLLYEDDFSNFRSVIRHVFNFFTRYGILSFSIAYVLGKKTRLYNTCVGTIIFLCVSFILNEYSVLKFQLFSDIVTIIQSIMGISIFFLSKRKFYVVKYELLLLMVLMLSFLELSVVLSFFNVVLNRPVYSLPILSVLLVAIILFNDDTLEKMFYSTHYLILLLVISLFLFIQENFNSGSRVLTQTFFFAGLYPLAQGIFKRKRLVS